MASVRFELSAKETDRPELRVWLRYGSPQRRLSCRTGLYGFRDHWSEKKQTHTVKMVNPLFRAEIIEVNEKLGHKDGENQPGRAKYFDRSLQGLYSSSTHNDTSQR